MSLLVPGLRYSASQALTSCTRTLPVSARSFVTSSSTSNSGSSSSSRPSPPPASLQSGTVQSADEEIAARAQMSRMAMGGMDMSSMPTPNFEPIVDPMFSPRYLFRAGLWGYIVDATKRYLATWQYTNAMMGTHQLVSTGKRYTWRTAATPPRWRLKPLLSEFQEMYEAYNAATAARDLSTLRSISKSVALNAGKTVATAKDGSVMKWECLSKKTPYLLSARVGQLDMLGKVHAAQLAVRFDSEQLLTITRGRKVIKKQQRVVENYMFERVVPSSQPWMIKGKYEPELPDFCKEQ